MSVLVAAKFPRAAWRLRRGSISGDNLPHGVLACELRPLPIQCRVDEGRQPPYIHIALKLIHFVVCTRPTAKVQFIPLSMKFIKVYSFT